MALIIRFVFNVAYLDASVTQCDKYYGGIKMAMSYFIYIILFI